jgi:putative Mn2+ efflux pump MntP
MAVAGAEKNYWLYFKNKLAAMKESERKDSPWTIFFLVTSLCFFGFSAALEFLESSFPQLFIWIGGASLILCLISVAGKFLGRTEKNKRRLSS